MSGDGTVVVEHDVAVPMRDGVVLRADVYRPVDDGRYPVLLGRTCYDKTTWAAWLRPVETALGGYAVVVNDMRGTFASDGEFRPFFNEIDDGYDTVEWCAVQKWSTGKVGMFGSSACGYVQLLAALARPPHLTAIAPMQTWSSFGRGCVYDPGGGFSMYSQEWALLQAVIDPRNRLEADRPGFVERRQEASRAFHEIERWHWHLPLSEFPPLPRDVADYYHSWIEHPDHDAFWLPIDVENRYDEIEVPALHLAGWFDRFCRSTLDNYVGLKASGRSEAARNGQKLVVGPWPHGIPVETACDDAFYGPAGYVDAQALVLRWFDYWLKGVENGVLDEPRIRLFVQGVDEWRDEADWPLERATPTPYYLHSTGCANTLDGNGALSANPPGAEPPDSYLYDPADPVPSTPGRFARPRGPVDQRPIELREDVLVYTSAPLEGDLEVTGPLHARLWASSSAPDTDWAVKLVDAYPDGYARRVSDGMIRARYRESQSHPQPLEPGRVYEYEIRMLPTAYVFRAGHRIRIEVASSSFAAYDRNLNTGRRLGEDATGETAEQLVYHDAERPSHVLLPIVDNTAR